MGPAAAAESRRSPAAAHTAPANRGPVPPAACGVDCPAAQPLPVQLHARLPRHAASPPRGCPAPPPRRRPGAPAGLLDAPRDGKHEEEEGGGGLAHHVEGQGDEDQRVVAEPNVQPRGHAVGHDCGAAAGAEGRGAGGGEQCAGWRGASASTLHALLAGSAKIKAAAANAATAAVAQRGQQQRS